MIPKIIHYCWFGRGKMPQDAINCIESWKRVLPDYELKLWNEDNFDIQSNRYVREAYESRKFAFVTDYVRLYALYTEGGIYMDTDVEVLKPLDRFLHHNAFSGFESNEHVPTGIMASEKGGRWVKENLSVYDSIPFILSNGELDLTPNVIRITDHLVPFGLKQNNTFQEFEGLITMYPSDYFCPKSHKTRKINLTENTYTIHHFAGSWLPKHLKYKKFLRNIMGHSVYYFLLGMYKRIFRWKSKK